MVAARVQGHTIQETADMFRCSTSTVGKMLSWAKRANLLVTAEDDILQNMVPEAGRVIKEQLAAGNARVAVEVMKGAGIFRKAGSKSPANPGGDGGSELSKHIAGLRARALLEEATVEGALLDPYTDVDPARLLESHLEIAPGQPERETPSSDGDPLRTDGAIAPTVGEEVQLGVDETGNDGSLRVTSAEERAGEGSPDDHDGDQPAAQCAGVICPAAPEGTPDR